MLSLNKYRSVCLLLILSVFFSFCSRKLDVYYNPKDALDKNIIEVLEADGRFAKFVSIVDKLGLRKTLGSSAMYTCLAPRDEYVEQYFSKLGYTSLESVPETLLRQYINYHFINGMYYEYDINKIYDRASSDLNKTRATVFSSRTEGKTPGKRLRLFSTSFLTRQLDDYVSLYNQQPQDYTLWVDNVPISEADIDASNGVIHVLGQPLDIALRTDEALASDPETSIFSSWLEKHVQYVLGEKDEFGWVDTTLYKSYSIGRNLADESVLSTIFVPTNDAILNYFQPYLPYLDNTIDSVPQLVITALLRACIFPNISYKSNFDDVSAEWKALSGGNISMIMHLPSIVTGSIRASNSIIYKSNQLILSPHLHSAVGGVYLFQKKYSQWNWMFSNAGMASGLFDGLNYQHSPITILIQSDDVWGTPLAEDMNDATRAYRINQCKSGILNVDVRAEGGFRKKFYPTNFGYVLYDNGRFYDYTGNSVQLITSAATWEGVNGAIYEVDGFLTPLDRQNDTLSVYNKIAEHPDLSLFKTAIDRVGMAAQLKLTGFFTYSVFAPVNSVITEAGINVNTMPVEELRYFLQTYIIPNRYIFSDGDFNGQITNSNGNRLTISGSWETFSVSNELGSTIQPVVANLQASNGVLHKINSLF